MLLGCDHYGLTFNLYLRESHSLLDFFMNVKMDMWYKIMFIVTVLYSPCTFGLEVWNIHIYTCICKNKFVLCSLFKYIYIAYLNLSFQRKNVAK